MWIKDHPEVIAFATYALTAVVTQLFKPRTPEQYAALPPRVAAFLKTVAALGIDFPKLLEGLGELVARKAPPISPPEEPDTDPEIPVTRDEP